MTPPLHRRATSGFTTASPDVLDDLFGPKISFRERLTLLDPHVESLLWAVINHIDVKTFQSIMSAKRPSRELVLHLRANADSVGLHDAFRTAFATHSSLGQVAPVSDVQERKERQARLPAAPTSSDLVTSRELLRPAAVRSKTRTLPFAEIKHPDQWETEVLRVFRDRAPPLVVVFCDPLTLLSEEYVLEMSRLAQECRESGASAQAKFMRTTMPVIRERAESIVDEAISEFPTTLIIFPPESDASSTGRKRPGYRRVNGPNVKAIRKRLFGQRQPSTSSTPTSSGTRSASDAFVTVDLVSNSNAESSDVLEATTGSPNRQEPVNLDKAAGRDGDVQPTIAETAQNSRDKARRVPQLLVPVSQTRHDAFLSPDVVLQWLADSK